MFGTIRKHSAWLWVIIITGIIISFVVYFTPNAMQGGGGNVTVTIDGRDFTRDQINAASREVQVGALLGLARAPASNDEATERALERLLVTTKLDQYGISVGPEATAAWIRDRIMREGGPFAGLTLEQVAAQFVEPRGLTAADLTRFARHQAGFEVLLETIGTMAALVTPKEVEAAYLRDHEKLEVEVAYVANSNFLAKVVLDPAEVMKFYSNRVAAYRAPELVQVRYVRFASSNHLAKAEANLNADNGLDNRVTQTYLQSTNMFAGVDEAEAKRRVRQQMIDEEAFQLAKRDAYDFINKYYDSPFEGGPVKAAELMASHVAASQALGIELKSTNPFSRDGLPDGLAVGPEFVDAAFSLRPEDPFSTAVSAADGFYALCYENRIPGVVEPFEKVKERVENEFRLDGARKLAREAADALYQAATNAVAGGQAFSTLAENSGFTVTRIPALTLRTTSLPGITLPADIHTISAIANNQETNTVSRPQFAADGLLVVRTGARTPPDALEMEMGLAEYRASVRRARESEILNDWIMKQMELSGLQNVLRNPQ